MLLHYVRRSESPSQVFLITIQWLFETLREVNFVNHILYIRICMFVYVHSYVTT